MVTKPFLVQTSTVVKSTASRTSQWAWRKVCQVVCRFRSGAGSMPCPFRMLPTVASERVRQLTPVRLAWTGKMYGGKFKGRQPEALTPEEWAEIRAYLQTGAAGGWTIE